MNFLTAFVDAMVAVAKIEDAESEIKQLQSDNYRMSNECGSCRYWMTQDCPRETLTNKVSMGQPKCSKFSMDMWTASFIQKNEDKISENQKFLSNP